jgi:hypothetical protein
MNLKANTSNEPSFLGQDKPQPSALTIGIANKKMMINSFLSNMIIIVYNYLFKTG